MSFRKRSAFYRDRTGGFRLNQYGNASCSGTPARSTYTSYFNYFNAQLTPFGPSETDPTKGYYSYDLWSWHVVVLNGTCARSEGAPAVLLRSCSSATTWRRIQPPARSFTLHKPRFSPGPAHGGDEEMDALWGAFYDGGVNVVLSGDDHDYERFAPPTQTGSLDLTRGVTEFVVGTGGRLLHLFEDAIPQANG